MERGPGACPGAAKLLRAVYPPSPASLSSAAPSERVVRIKCDTLTAGGAGLVQTHVPRGGRWPSQSKRQRTSDLHHPPSEVFLLGEGGLSPGLEMEALLGIKLAWLALCSLPGRALSDSVRNQQPVRQREAGGGL